MKLFDLPEHPEQCEPKRCRTSVSPVQNFPKPNEGSPEPTALPSSAANLACTETVSSMPPQGPEHVTPLAAQPECGPKAMPQDPFFIELCAGSARVTTCLQFFGLKSSFGVDHKCQKNSGRLLTADLTSSEGQAICMQWLSSPNCVGIFAAPPCGTCSRARGIPLRLPTESGSLDQSLCALTISPMGSIP